MAVRLCAIRLTAGFGTIANSTLAVLALAGGTCGPASQALAQNGWGSGGAPRSVLVQPSGSRSAAQYASQQGAEPMAIEEIAPGPVASEPFDGAVPNEGVIVGSPDDGGSYGDAYVGDGSYDNAVDGVYGSPFNGGYGEGFAGQEPGQLPCGVSGCQGHCAACQQAACDHPEWRFNADCEPMGLLQKMYLLHRGLKSDGRWTGRIDALILSRNAPANRPLYTFNPASAGPVLNANQLESIAAVGPRVSLFHGDACGTASWETTYIYSGWFVSDKSLAPAANGYQLADPGIYGVLTPNPNGGLDSATARLTSNLQTAEINRRWCLGSCAQFLAGFRWIQWQENVAISDSYEGGNGQDVYTTGAYNNLFGGQIGLDTLLWQPSKHFRLEGLVKGGAYYNSAYQSSVYQSYLGGAPFDGNSVSVGASPATCSFAGELGFTGVIPISCNVDFRFGYFGLWLTSLAQPTNQLSGQNLVPASPVYGSLTTNGNVVLQGLSLGLEGRW